MQDIRKVQLTHKETLIVSLPKRWYPQFPVRGGDEVSLILQPDGSVVLRRIEPGQSAPPLRITTHGAPLAQTLARIEDVYAGGADAVTVTGLETASDDDRFAIRRRLAGLFGSAIEDETTTLVEVRFLAVGRNGHLSHAVRRMVALTAAALHAEAVAVEDVLRARLLLLRLAARLLDGRDPPPTEGDARWTASWAMRVADALHLLTLASPGRGSSGAMHGDVLNAAGLALAANDPAKLSASLAQAQTNAVPGDSLAATLGRLTLAVVQLLATPAPAHSTTSAT